MKWSAIKLSPRLLRAEDAAAFVGGDSILRDLEKAGWIHPVKRGNRLTIWDAKKLDEACDRLQREVLPGWDTLDGATAGLMGWRTSGASPQERMENMVLMGEYRTMRRSQYERQSPIPDPDKIRRA